MARHTGGERGGDGKRASGDRADSGDGKQNTDDRDVAGRRDSGTDLDEESAFDADELRSEWHLWLLAIVLVVGLAGLFAPADTLPEVLVGLAPILVVVAVIAGVGQWLFRRYR